MFQSSNNQLSSNSLEGNSQACKDPNGLGYGAGNCGAIHLMSSTDNSFTGNSVTDNFRHGMFINDAASTGNLINANTFCSNNKSTTGSYYDIYDADTTTGDNNVFCTSNGYKDSGQSITQPYTYGCTGICKDHSSGGSKESSVGGGGGNRYYYYHPKEKQEELPVVERPGFVAPKNVAREHVSHESSEELQESSAGVKSDVVGVSQESGKQSKKTPIVPEAKENDSKALFGLLFVLMLILVVFVVVMTSLLRRRNKKKISVKQIDEELKEFKEKFKA